MAARNRPSERKPAAVTVPAAAAPTSDIGKLDLSGAQTIRSIEAAHAQLRGLLATHAAVEIDCTATTEADISLVQLLLAARRSAEQSGKTIVLAKPAGGALLDVLSRGGFLSAAAEPVTADGAFWLKGASEQ